MLNCKLCNMKLEGKQKVFCCKEHRDKFTRDTYYKSETYLKKREEKIGSVYNICAICGWKAKSLMTHLWKVHRISKLDYCRQYNKTNDDVVLKDIRKKWGAKIKGNKNSAYNHGGKYSPYSKSFIKYQGLSDVETQTKINMLLEKNSKALRENGHMPSQVKYWTDKGYSEEEAKQKISERQKTFSLEKCIAKYGEEKGRKRWEERQKKWQNTLKSKPPEEIERINRAKMGNTGYSKISQKLFWSIYEKIKDKYENIYFAERGNKENNEYFFITYDSNYFFDFFIKDIGKIIEFDGDYWHGKARGNQKRERERDKKIVEAGLKVFHIQERSYKVNPTSAIEKCLEFING